MKEKIRYIFIDLLRGWAILIMIEVHVFNAFLLPDLKQTNWFDILTFINGLVAPAFLFVSGFAFAVSSGSKLDDMRKLKYPFWKKLWRYFSIILIGYVLHLPETSLSKTINEASPELLQQFFAVDVLQCIGAGLLILFAMRLLINSNKVYNYSLIGLMIIVLILSPIFWETDFTAFFHPVFANYFNRMNGSLFPLFPWVNFILAGAIFAKYFIDTVKKGSEQKFIRVITLAGMAMLLCGHLFFSGLFPDVLMSITPNPMFFIERLGYIFFFASLCWYFNKWKNVKKSFVLDASRESLLIYWLHLLVIYSTIWNSNSLVIIYGSSFNVWESIAATLVLMLLMVFVAKLWGWTKKKYPKYAIKVAWGVVGVLFMIFLLS